MNTKKRMTKLRIGGVPEHFNLPWKLSIESGSLTKFNVDASWTDFHSGSGAMVQALNNDQIDIATLLTEGAIAALAKKSAQFELFSFYTKTPLIWGIHVPSQSKIKNLKDIESATFAISRYGSGSHLMAFLLAESLGLDGEKLNFKIINNLDGARELFKSGGDYIFLWEKFMTKPFVDNGEMKRIDDFPTPWSCFVICIRKSVLEQHKLLVESVVQNVLDTANDLKNSPLVEKLIAREFQLEMSDVKEWLKTIQWHQTKTIDKKLITKVKTKLKTLNII